MNDREKYLFDVQGYLLVRNFLTPEEVKQLNAAFDANRDKMGEDGNSNIGNSNTLRGERKRGIFTGMLTWEHPWCEPFRDLLAHPKAIPYLNTMLGRGWRLDHEPFLLCGGAGAEGLILHGPGHNFDGAQYYTYKNGRMRCGIVVLQYQLADVNPGDGGFCCIPGSHKANYPCPREILEWEAEQDAVSHIPCKAGDLLIFNEATTHGTLPWSGKQERRSLLYRFSPKYLHFAGGYYRSEFPEWTSELTEAQRAVLEPPYIYHHPLIEDDGKTVVRPLREEK
ncbi:MAG TPA: phytanoyl-CoA dioxygenase family protein [Chthonomonadaceae bacterium]|nr:phytanoyl-CoA dioxygenase family protein [Chthonomonadaceae bacterium]